MSAHSFIKGIPSFLAPKFAKMAANQAKAITANGFLKLGLEVLGYRRWESYKYNANLNRFKEHFGILPSTCSDVWEKLRLSDDDDCRLDPKAKPIHLLLTINYLWRYQTEEPHAKLFHMTKNTARKWKYIYLKKLEALFPHLVSWVSSWQENFCPAFLQWTISF